MANLNQPKTILLIDDDDIHNFIFDKVVQNSGILATLHTYTSGQGGLDFVKSHLSDQDLPDMIFLDLFMPVMDGWEFLREYGKIPLKKRPTLFLLSSSANGVDEAKASKHPEVRAFLPKPITMQTLANLALEYLAD